MTDRVILATAPPARSPASDGPRSHVASTALRTTSVAFGRRFLGAGIRADPTCFDTAFASAAQ